VFHSIGIGLHNITALYSVLATHVSLPTYPPTYHPTDFLTNLTLKTHHTFVLKYKKIQAATSSTRLFSTLKTDGSALCFYKQYVLFTIICLCNKYV